MKIVITGGPCSGKTTLITELKATGLKSVPEAAFYLIRKEERGKKKIFPWTNIRSFQSRLDRLQIGWEKKIERREMVFLDRSIIDSIAYHYLNHVEVPNYVKDYASRADYDHVFMLDMLPRQYWEKTLNKKPRMITYQFAKEVHKMIEHVYKSYGYNIIRVPVMPVEEREGFILRHVYKSTGKLVVLN